MFFQYIYPPKREKKMIFLSSKACRNKLESRTNILNPSRDTPGSVLSHALSFVQFEYENKILTQKNCWAPNPSSKSWAWNNTSPGMFKRIYATSEMQFLGW